MKVSSVKVVVVQCMSKTYAMNSTDKVMLWLVVLEALLIFHDLTATQPCHTKIRMLYTTMLSLHYTRFFAGTADESFKI